MKFLQKLLPVLMLIAGLFIFQSCEKDKKPSINSPIIGQWQATHGKEIVYIGEDIKRETDTLPINAITEIWTFNGDGTGSMHQRGDKEHWAEEWEWTSPFDFEITSDTTVNIKRGSIGIRPHIYKVSDLSLFIQFEKFQTNNVTLEEERIEMYYWFKKL